MNKSLLVLALLVGCGDDGIHHLPDAPEAPDAAPPDAPLSGAVTLTVRENGSPRADVDVYFLAADNALVAKVPTDAQGVASAVMGLGGSVTAIDPFPSKSSSRDVRTFVGVKPGDNLRLIQQSGAQSGATNFTLVLPADALASNYEVHTSCGILSFIGGGGSGSGSGTAIGGLSTLYNCGATIDIMIETYDGGGLPLGAIYKSGVALSEGSTVDLTAEAYVTPVPTSTINWSNVPTPYTHISATVLLATSKGLLRTIDVTPGALAAGAASASYTRPTVSGGVSITESAPFPTNNIGKQMVLDWAPQSTAPMAVDLGAALLPTYSAMPSVSGATRTVTWAAGAGVAPDFAWASISAHRFVGKSSTSWYWSIVVPYTSTTFTLPLLPADVGDLNFSASDLVNVDELTTAKVPGGYDAVRADILSSFGPEQFVAGPSGRIVVETRDIFTPARVAQPPGSWALRSMQANQ